MLKSKKQLLSIIRNLTNGFIAGNPIPNANKHKKIEGGGYSHFSDVFLVSALNGDGVSDIKVRNIHNIILIKTNLTLTLTSPRVASGIGAFEYIQLQSLSHLISYLIQPF